LSQPLEARLRALGVAQLEPAFRALVTGIGYGYIERDAAAYLWKYLSVWVPMLPFTLQPTEYELFETGYQGFFERIAEHLDRTAEPRRRRVVRTGCKVTRVERPEGERPITVHLDGQQEPLSFDRLVLACPLDAAARFLDADNDERELLQKIRSYTFHTLFATVRDYPANRWAFYLSNCRPGHAPRPVLSARRHFELDHVVFYVLEEHDPQVITGDGPCYFDVDPRNLPGTEPRRDAHIRQIWDSLEYELRTRMGLTGVTRHRHVAWKYFPHYSTEDVARGAPIELERRQGLRRTYYIGEVMDFSVIERCVLYAEHTAKQHFTG
jgi:hypothetical protein